MATINETFVPIEALHPTELIKDELEARGMRQSELAERLGMKAPNLSRFLNRKESITIPMARKLEEALGIPADYWLRLQVSYEKDMEAIAQRDREEISARQAGYALAAAFNLPLLLKRLSLDSYTFFKDRLKALYQLFNVSSLEELLSLSAVQGCFKKSTRLEAEERNIGTWVLLARYECCKEIGTLPPYVLGSEIVSAREIASLANSQTITEDNIRSILGRKGIGYCVVEKLEKTPVDAYSAIIGGHPFIVVSHRRNNMDMLVFDVLHECGHINKHLKEGGAYVSYNQNLVHATGVEQEANRFAMDMLIPPDKWADMMAGKSRSLNPYSLIKTITNEAKKNGISPTIAAWRFKYETGVYKIRGYKSPAIR